VAVANVAVMVRVWTFAVLIVVLVELPSYPGKRGSLVRGSRGSG
jgi:hypothetical protein